MKPWYQDPSLWTALFAILLPPISKKLGVPMDPSQLASLTAIALTHMAGHHWGRGKSA